MRFKHCIFDLYGTLVDIRTDEDSRELWEYMAGQYGSLGAQYSPEELRGAYLRIIGQMERGAVSLRHDAHEAHPEIQIEYVFQSLCREKGVELSLPDAVELGRIFRRRSTEYIRLYPGARELLTTLRARGRRVWLLSNAQAIFTRDELERLEITELFDGIYLSSDYGVKKPERQFFDALLRGQDIDPAGAVMVGNDGICDIAGARAVGLSTVYIRSNISPQEPLPEADYVLDHMDLAKVGRFLTGEL